MSDRIETMHSPDELYKKIGFSSIEKMIEYGRLIGKNYEGIQVHTIGINTRNMHDAHKKIFAEELEDKVNRRNKFFPEPVPVPVLPPNPKVTTFGFILLIGTSEGPCTKTTEHKITIPNISMLRPTINNTLISITIYIQSQTYHDQIFANIRHYSWNGDELTLGLTSVRSNNEGWWLQAKAHVLLNIFEGNIPYIT
jgi:hypothetical protein